MRSLTIALYLSVTSEVLAQGQFGTITGTITDPDGQAVANAVVRSRNSGNPAM